MKLTDVTDVVMKQLEKQGVATNDATKTMSALHMDEVDAALLLKKVKTLLKAYNPSYTFAYPPPSAADVLACTILKLIGLINDNTK